VTADPKRIIAAVAERHGVLLDRDDPLLMMATVMDLHAQDHLEREDRREERDRQLLARMQEVVAEVRTQAARPLLTADEMVVVSGNITRRTLESLDAAVNRLVVQRFRWLLILAAVGLVVACAASAGVAWFVSRGPDVTCRQINGGIFCGYWQVEPPTAGKP
jgi:hypothetical protein